MGKREFLLIAAFVLIGIVAYQFTAPAPKDGEGFSIRKIFSGIKRELSENNASATVSKSGTITLRPEVTSLRISTERSVPVTVIGETRTDIAYDLPVESTGPDEVSARKYAEQSTLLEDDLGAVLGIRTKFPREGTQTARLTLRVPDRLTVRVEGTSRVQVSQVAGVDLRNIGGETSISNVPAVTGSHRAGELTVTGAAKVDLALSASRAKIRAVTESIQLNARNSECSIASSSGSIAITMTTVELTIDHHEKGTIRIGGDGGRATINTLVSPLSIDARRMLVDLKVDTEAAGDITVITTEEPVRLALAGDASLAIDAVTTDAGAIKVTDFEFQPVVKERESRLTATIGRGAARAVIRNASGDIVISRRK